jgi:hypothetical protein
MMPFVLAAFLVVEPAAVTSPAAVTVPPAAGTAEADACKRRSGSIIYLDRDGPEAKKTSSEQPCPAPADAKMAIDELGMPIDYKDKKGKGVVTGAADCDDADPACRASACAAQQTAIVDTYGGHGAQGMAITEQGVPDRPKKGKAVIVAASSAGPGGCPAPAGMAINEKGTTGTKTKKSTK